MDIRILHEEKGFLVCEKPVGLLSEQSQNPGAGGEDSLLSLLSRRSREKGESGDIFPLHRLDRMVGGVMVFAKDKGSAAALSRTIAEGKMEKTYLAVCQGDVSVRHGREGELCDLLFKDSGKNKTFVVARKRRGVKEAKLCYRVLAVAERGENADVPPSVDKRPDDLLPSVAKVDFFEKNPVSLLQVRLITGRTHQVRVQFSSRGHALLGDGKYGSREKGCEVALFSASLSFPHPKTGEMLTFALPIPSGYPWNLFAGLPDPAFKPSGQTQRSDPVVRPIGKRGF